MVINGRGMCCNEEQDKLVYIDVVHQQGHQRDNAEGSFNEVSMLGGDEKNLCSH